MTTEKEYEKLKPIIKQIRNYIEFYNWSKENEKDFDAEDTLRAIQSILEE